MLLLSVRLNASSVLLLTFLVLAVMSLKLANCQNDPDEPDYEPEALESMLTSITDSYYKNQGTTMLALTDWVKTWNSLQYYVRKGDEDAIRTVNYSLNVVMNKNIHECLDAIKKHAPEWKLEQKEYDVMKERSQSRISPELLKKMDQVRLAVEKIKESCKVLDWTPFTDMTKDLNKFAAMCRVALCFLDDCDDE